MCSQSAVVVNQVFCRESAHCSSNLRQAGVLVQLRSRVLCHRLKLCKRKPLCKPLQLQISKRWREASTRGKRAGRKRCTRRRRWTQARQQLRTLCPARPPATNLAPARAGRGRYLRQEALFTPGLCAGSAEGRPGAERLLYRLTHSAGRAFRHARRAARPAAARSGAATTARAPAGRAR